MEQPLISIVLATYNGEKYIREQLDSIFNQTHKHMEVLVFDDGSTDDTLAILADIAKYKPMLRIQSNTTKAGVVQNFGKAIAAAHGDYIALCDQDDIWLPSKLEATLSCLQDLERKQSIPAPALVFTDLKVVDENLKMVNHSYWNHMKLNPENYKFNRVLVENVATGCTIMINKATKELALPIPMAALMHDVWLLLTASYFGNVKYLPEPTVLYRQHSSNAIGAKNKSMKDALLTVYNKFIRNDISLLKTEIEQAKAFYLHHEERLNLNLDKKQTLEAFISLKQNNVWRRKLLLVKYSFYRSSFAKTASLVLRA